MKWESGHKTYILRVWPVDRDAQPALVAVLEDCQTNERQAFASLSELLAFLEASGRALSPVAHHSFESEEAKVESA